MIECPFCETESDRDSCTHWYGGCSDYNEDFTGYLSDFWGAVKPILIDWLKLTGAKASIDYDFGVWISNTEWDLQEKAKSSLPDSDCEKMSDWLHNNLYWPTAYREFTDFFFYECVREISKINSVEYTEYDPDDEESEDDIPGMSFGRKDIWVVSDHQILTQQIQSHLATMRSMLNSKWIAAKGT